MASPVSANFGFLARHDQQLVALGGQAERYFAADPATCVIKLRQFGEVLARLTAANAGITTSPAEKQLDMANRLRAEGLLRAKVRFC